MRPAVVMKLGGTSVGTPNAVARSAHHVVGERRPKLVVVSAVDGVTDLLLQAAETASRGGETEPLLCEIEKRHQEIVDKHSLSTDLLDPLPVELQRLLSGISMSGELTPRIEDLLLSLGERMSARLMSGLLRKMDQPARAFDAWELGLETDATYGRAEPVADCAERIRRALDDIDPKTIPVVTGFIGRTVEGHVTTLGRGGSDFSAALFGAACGVEEIQIWTDVPGFLRADPRVVRDAERIGAMRFEEAAELAYFGAQVLHPRTIEPARRAGIPVRVLGTFQVDPDGDEPISAFGTLIHDGAPTEPVRALAVQRQVQSLHIHSSGMLDAPGFLARVFDIFARHGISVDVIATSEVSVSLTLDRDGLRLSPAVDEISAFAEVERAHERSILCLVGAGLREDTSLLARIFSALASRGIPVHVVSQGASRINITLVTDPEYADEAMQALHAELF